MPAFTILYRDVMRQYGKDLGLDSYPIFDEAYRETLNDKIRARYSMREIGQESVSLFALFLERKMKEIMPYYNQLYKSELIQIDPLATIDMTTTREGEASTDQKTQSETQGTSDSENKARVVVSDTPQSVLADDGNYASGLNDTIASTGVESTGKEDSELSSESATRETSTVTGTQGSQAIALQMYRETFLNIDTMILDNLEVLFMQIWDVPEPYTHGVGLYGF